jgi:putative membrane protein
VTAGDPTPERADPDLRPTERPYRRLSPLTPLVRSALLLAAALAFGRDDILSGHPGPVAWFFLAALVAGLAYGTASWVRTKYWVEADELRVDTGVVSRQSRRIRVDRIQGIDIVQPFVARLFGLAELRMDVAGGGAKEGSLAFLPLSEARELRETLLVRRDAVRSLRSGHAPDTDPRGAPAPETRVAALDLRMLVVSLLLAPETVGFVVAAVALGSMLAFFGQLGSVAGVLSVLVGFALTQFRKLSAYYGLTLTASASGLHVRRGLFELNTQTVNLARVQGVLLTEPLMWRRLGWARLDVSVAGHQRAEDNGKPSASTVMPVARRALALSLARTLLADAGAPDPAAVVLVAPPARARWAAPVRARFMAFGVGEDLVVSREGVLTRRTHIVPHARVQSLQLHQGPWQRRLGLADLEVDSPPGRVRVRARHRDVAEARALLDREVAVTARARTSAPPVR